MKNILFILFILFFFISKAQFSRDINILENEVIKLNRIGKQKQSQEKIIYMLSKNVSNEDAIRLNFLIANTFRSVNDYSSAIYYLSKAKKYSCDDNSKECDSLNAILDAELAFVTFDSNDYLSSNKIIHTIQKNNYRYLSQENKAYIIMQDGYIKFINKDYQYAEKCFFISNNILKKIHSCNQPAIMVKQMELYAAKNNLIKCVNIYTECKRISKKCKILKYEIYATEKLCSIYKNINDKDKFLLYSKYLDSLKNLDNIDRKKILMNKIDKNYIETTNSYQINKKNSLILIFLIVILLGIIVIFNMIINNKKLKNKLICKLKDYENIKDSKQLSELNEIEFTLGCLSKRHRDIILLALEGHTNREIASKLFLSEATIKYHFKNIFEILNVKNRKELFKLFYRKNTN